MIKLIETTKEYLLIKLGVKKEEPKITEEPKKVYVLKSRTQDEERDELLRKTSQAHNSAVILKHLRTEARKYRIAQKGKLINHRHNYSDENINEIRDIVYEYAPNTDYWRFAIRKILMDADDCNFKKQPSMNRYQIKHLSFVNDRLEQKLDCFESINLSRHTLNLLKVFEEYFKPMASLREHSYFEIVMACLLHDYGKSRMLLTDICGSNDFNASHEKVSGWYIKKVMNHVESQYRMHRPERDDFFYFGVEEFEKIKIAVEDHHSEVEVDSLADILKKIDQKTREMEYIEYERKQHRITGSSVVGV